MEREISYTRLRDRYSWLPARNTGVGKARGNVETRVEKADPARLLFIYFLIRIVSVADLGDDCNYSRIIRSFYQISFDLRCFVIRKCFLRVLV